MSGSERGYRKPTTEKSHGACNLLLPYIPTREGWLYLATHKDIFNGEIVGYAMDSHMRESLVKNSLLMAIHKRKPGAGLIHHSDRGSQYEYQKLLKFFNIIPSMSRKGNCYDNAPLWRAFLAPLKMSLSIIEGIIQGKRR